MVTILPSRVAGRYRVIETFSDSNRIKRMEDRDTRAAAKRLAAFWEGKLDPNEPKSWMHEATKSDVIRQLHTEGKSILEIHKETGIRYQMVHNVIKRGTKGRYKHETD